MASQPRNKPAFYIDGSLKTVLDAAPVGMIVFNDRKTVVYANPEAERLFGRNPTAAEALRCGDFIGCAKRHLAPQGCGHTSECPHCPLFQAIHRTLASDPPAAFEGRDLRLEREAPLNPIWIDFKTSPFMLEGHRGLILSIDDISDRKQNEQHLQDALAELAVIHANAPVVMMLVDHDRRVRKIGGLAAQMSGREPEASIGLRGGEALRCLHHLDDPRGCGFSEACRECAIRRAVSETFASGQNQLAIEAWLPIPMGDAIEERCLLVATAHLKIGGSDRVLVSALDITERKRAEIALQESEQRFRDLYEQAPLGYQSLDADGRLIEVNRAWLDMLGYGLSDVIGHGFGEFLAPSELAAFQRRFPRFLAAGRVHTDFQMIRRDGSEISVHVDGCISRDKRGRFKQTHCILADVTARKRAEEALRSERDLIERIMATSPAGIIRLDAEGRINYANKRAEKILGLRLAAMMGRAYDDARWNTADFEGRSVSAEALPFNVVKRTKKAVFGVQQAIAWPDGKRILLSINAAPLRGKKAAFEGMVATIEDITDRYDAEQKYQMLFREMLDGFALHEIICDDKGRPVDYRFLAVNPAFERLTGLKAETLVGKNVLEVLPQTEAFWIETYGKVALTGKPAFFENYAKELDRYFQVTAFRPSANQFACIFVDISERKKAEAERERLLLAIEQAEEMVVITDAGGIMQYVNPAFERITGFPGREALGQTPRILKSGHHDQTFYHDLWSTILSGKPWKGRLINKRRSGGVYTAECSISPIRDDKGQVVHFVWISRDITKELELEKRVSQAQKMEAIGALAGGIAHDFNNLLFPILGLSEMLREDLPPASPEHGNAEEIFKAARRASGLVKQILAFSRQTEQEKTPIQIQRILKEIVRLARATIPSDIAIQAQIQQDCGPVLTSPTQMHQIAMNLVTNAYHAIEPEPGEIRVGLQEVTLANEPWPGSALAEGRYALLRVTDTGCGIGPTELGRIFEPYFTTKAPGKGTGLGLAVVYGIVKEHQGDIKVYSVPGKGSTFEVYLPLLGDTRVEMADEAAPPLPVGTERILVIDDEEAVVRLQRQMLESLGYRVSIRTDSLEGLNVFRRETDRFDLVITDMTMPGMTGDRLAAELLKTRPDVPIILCTGFSERITPEKAKTIGIKDFLMKPVAKAQLARAVRKALDETRPSG